MTGHTFWRTSFAKFMENSDNTITSRLDEQETHKRDEPQTGRNSQEPTECSTSMIQKKEKHNWNASFCWILKIEKVEWWQIDYGMEKE